LKKIIYIIRHGETELNKLGIVQGRGVDSELNDKGRDQADALLV
jgi:probable phosphoglycerate mutase